ncbi:MAG: nucleotide disphospho-sugar-binding domain-containing protein [Microbacterium sp.]
MSSILICISPAESHVSPILDVVRAFASRGHHVRVLTGARFAERVRALDAEPIALPREADILDELDLRERPRGRRAINEGLTEAFIRPAEAQLPALVAALAAEHTDAIVIDPTILAAQLLGRDRPLIACCGIFPLSISSVDTPPFGLGMAPPRNGLERLRGRLMAWMARKVVLTGVHRDLDAFYTEHGMPGLGELFFTDYIFQPGVVDVYGQFTVPSFEYPRSDLPAHLHFFGPLASTAAPRPLPAWWNDLDDTRPVVHVSQGTVGNSDFSELIAPTLAALADEPVTVVVTTGGGTDGRIVGELPPLPANAVAADFVPYDQLMPRVSAFVTNGGYGGLQCALAAGAPIVVAGDTEDKIETSARVAWSGAGINLRTGHPTAGAIRKAVREVLTEPRYRRASARIAAEIAASPGAAGFAAEVERMIADRAGNAASTVPATRVEGQAG